MSLLLPPSRLGVQMLFLFNGDQFMAFFFYFKIQL